MKTCQNKYPSFEPNPTGYLSNLVDADASVAINLKTGRVLLNEGSGDNRYNRVFVEPFDDVTLDLQPTNIGTEVVLHFGKNSRHVIGYAESEQREMAVEWINAANQVIESYKPSKTL